MKQPSQNSWEPVRPGRRPVYLLVGLGALYLWWCLWSRSITEYAEADVSAFGRRAYLTIAAPRGHKPAERADKAGGIVARVEEVLKGLAKAPGAQGSLVLSPEERFVFDALLQAVDGWRASGAGSSNGAETVQVSCGETTTTLDARLLGQLREDCGMALALDEAARSLSLGGVQGVCIKTDAGAGAVALLRGSNGRRATDGQPVSWNIRIDDPRPNTNRPVFLNLGMTDAAVAAESLAGGPGVIVVTRRPAAWAAAFARGLLTLEPSKALESASDQTDTKVLIMEANRLFGATGGLEKIVQRRGETAEPTPPS